MSLRTIVSGEEVLLYLNERKSWIVRVEEGKKFHCHRGIVDLGDLVGKPYGYEAVTTLGARLKVMPSVYLDHLERISRRTQCDIAPAGQSGCACRRAPAWQQPGSAWCATGRTSRKQGPLT